MSAAAGRPGRPRQRKEDLVVREFKKLVTSTDSGDMWKWHECKRLALSQMANCTPFRTAQILYWCKRGRFCDEELLGSVLRVGLDDDEYMLGFDGFGISMSIQSLGMLVRLAKRGRMWKGRSTERLVRYFAVRMLSTNMKTAMFKGREFDARTLSSILHGLGLLFPKRGNRRIDPQILEISKALVAAFLGAYQKSDNLDISISTALHGCANLGLSKCDAFLRDGVTRDLVSSVLNDEKWITGRVLSIIVWSMSKMGLDDVAALDMLSRAMGKADQLAKMKFREMSNIVYGFGALNYCNSHVLDKISAEIAKHDERLRSCNGQDLSNIVYSWGMMNYHNLDALDQMSVEITREDTLASFTEQGLANIVYGWGLLKYCNVDALDKIAFEIGREDRLRSLTEQNLANVVYGLGLLNRCSSDFMNRICGEIGRQSRLRTFTEQGLSNVVYGLGLLKHSNSDFLDKISAEIGREDRLRSFTEQALANIVYGFGLLNFCNPDVLGRICAEIEREDRLRSFTEQGLANIVYGFGLLGYCNSDVLDRVSAEIGREDRLRSFTEQELSNIVYGFGLLGYVNLGALDRVCMEIGREDRLEAFGEQHVANIVKGLSDMRYLNKQVLDILLQRYVRLGDISEDDQMEQHLGMMMIACAVLNCHNSDFLETATTYIRKAISKTSDCQWFCNSLWSYVVLDILEADFFLDVCKHMDRLRLSGVDLEVSNMRQLAQAWIYLTVVKKQNLDIPDAARALVENAIRLSKSALKTRKSTFEVEISKLLVHMGVPFSTDVPVANGFHRADILVSDGSSKLVIECDGPSHFSSNRPDGSYMVLGGTLLRNRILEAHGYKVVCVPFFANRSKIRELLKSSVLKDLDISKDVM